MIKLSSNIYDIFKKVFFNDGYSYKKIYEDIKNNKSGFILYEYKGENCYVIYIFIGVNDWYVIFVIL